MKYVHADSEVRFGLVPPWSYLYFASLDEQSPILSREGFGSDSDLCSVANPFVTEGVVSFQSSIKYDTVGEVIRIP